MKLSRKSSKPHFSIEHSWVSSPVTSQNVTAKSLKTTSAFVAILASVFLSFSTPSTAQEKKKDETKAISEIVDKATFSGSFLSARVAIVDRDLESAAAFYRRALELEPDNEKLMQNAFMTMATNGNFDEALALSKKLQSKKDNDIISKLVLAVDALRNKSYKAAKNQLMQVTRNDLDRLIGSLLQAWTEHGAGRTDVALKILSDLKGPSWYTLFVNYHTGLLAEAAGDRKLAIVKLTQAVDNKNSGRASIETYMRAILALARLQAKDGEKAAALSTIEKGRDLQPASPPLIAALENIEADLPLVANASNAQKGAAEVFLNIGTALNRDGGQQFTQIYLQLADELAPGTDAIIIALGNLYDSQSLPKRANTYFEQIDLKSPYHRLAELELALNLDELGEFDEAKSHLKRLLEEDPHDLFIYLSFGGLMARHEKFKEAAEIYDRAVASLGEPKRHHWNLYYRRGIAYERIKQWSKAEPSFLKALELFPDQPQVLNYLGYSWIDMNMNLDRGLTMIKKAVELRSRDGYIIDSLGWAYYRLGRYEDAVRELERALEFQASDPTINDHLGDAYWRVGRKLEAGFQWNHALALKPPTEDDIARIKDKIENGLPLKSEEKITKPSQEIVPDTTSEDKVEKKSSVGDEIFDTNPLMKKASLSGASFGLPQVTYHTVVRGESLWSIAREKLGKGARFTEIYELNRDILMIDDRLQQGQHIMLPAFD